MEGEVMEEKKLDCYYSGETDCYCHKEYTENIDKTECNKCENIICETKRIITLERQLQLKDKMIELMAKKLADCGSCIKCDNACKDDEDCISVFVDTYKQQALAELEE